MRRYFKKCCCVAGRREALFCVWRSKKKKKHPHMMVRVTAPLLLALLLLVAASPVAEAETCNRMINYWFMDFYSTPFTNFTSPDQCRTMAVSKIALGCVGYVWLDPLCQGAATSECWLKSGWDTGNAHNGVQCSCAEAVVGLLPGFTYVNNLFA